MRDDTCIHFRGIQHDTCLAGVDWRAVTGGGTFGIAKRMPCIATNNTWQVCSHYRLPTADELTADAAAEEAAEQQNRVRHALLNQYHTDAAQSIVALCYHCQPPHVETTSIGLTEHLCTTHGMAREAIQTLSGHMLAHLEATDWSQTDVGYADTNGVPLVVVSTRLRRRGAYRVVS